jgi:hypothetical protein
MPRHPTLGFRISAPPIEASHVVVGDLLRPVDELGHAPEPLKDMVEIVSSANYSFASRRYMREMESNGTSPKQIIQKMNELTPYTRIKIAGEFAILPPGTVLKATNRHQARVCTAALHLARRSEIEGFELHGEHLERPRLLLLRESVTSVIDIVDCHHWVPAHFLPDGDDDLFAVGR